MINSINEKGTALVIAMIFLGLLTTIGIYAIYNSSSELTTSGRYKSDKEAFYAAEGAIEYVKGDGYYFTTKTSMIFPDNDASPHPTVAARSLASNGTNAYGTITYVTSGNPPPGYGFSAKDTQSNYFIIDATGVTHPEDPDPDNKNKCRQEESVAKVLPKS